MNSLRVFFFLDRFPEYQWCCFHHRSWWRCWRWLPQGLQVHQSSNHRHLPLGYFDTKEYSLWLVLRKFTNNDPGQDDIPGVVGSTRGSRDRHRAQGGSGGVKAAPKKTSENNKPAFEWFSSLPPYPCCRHTLGSKLTLCSQEQKQGQMHCWNVLRSSLDRPTLMQRGEWKQVKTGEKHLGKNCRRRQARWDESGRSVSAQLLPVAFHISTLNCSPWPFRSQH